MTVGSLCSGISADSVAWGPLGWKHLFFSEIDPFCCKVLGHHYPGVINYGDFTTASKADFPAVDVLMVSTPCQDFSVAGRREGMGGSRGTLTMAAIGVIEAIRPRWITFENVPGLLQSECALGFRRFLARLAECGYGFAYRILDAQYAKLAQRRERVFLVGYLGDWRPAAAVFLDQFSLQWNPAPRGEEGQDIAGTLGSRTKGGGGLGTDFDIAGGLVASPLSVADTVKANSGRNQIESTYIASTIGGRMRGQDDSAANNVLETKSGVRRLTPRECERLMGFEDDYTMVPNYRKRQPEIGVQGKALYDYYRLSDRGKLYAEMRGGHVYSTPDGPRYKSIGNSIAVPILRWIGERIVMVDSILSNIGHKNLDSRVGFPLT